MVRRLLRQAALLVLLAGRAGAESFMLPTFKAGTLGLGVHLGAAVPGDSDGFANRAGRGPSVGLRFTRFMNDWLALGGELGAELFLKHKSSLTPGPAKDVVFDASAFFAGALARVNLFENSPWSPYLLGGAGMNRLSVKGTAPAPVCWPVAGACAPGVNASSMGLYVTGGGGVEFFFLRGMSASAEARWRQYRGDGRKVPGVADSVSVTLGTTFWF